MKKWPAFIFLGAIGCVTLYSIDQVKKTSLANSKQNNYVSLPSNKTRQPAAVKEDETSRPSAQSSFKGRSANRLLKTIGLRQKTASKVNEPISSEDKILFTSRLRSFRQMSSSYRLLDHVYALDKNYPSTSLEVIHEWNKYLFVYAPDLEAKEGYLKHVVLNEKNNRLGVITGQITLMVDDLKQTDIIARQFNLAVSRVYPGGSNVVVYTFSSELNTSQILELVTDLSKFPQAKDVTLDIKESVAVPL
jgi:hypothetical protein